MQDPWTGFGPSAEDAWSKLALHRKWTEGFWVAGLFCAHRALVTGFERRMDAELAAEGHTQVILRPASPDSARYLLDDLLVAADTGGRCIWVEIMRSGDVGRCGPDPWLDAWSWLMMRLNERRTLVQRRVAGGLIFVGSPSFKPHTAVAAPDLWSLRALVLEPAPPVRATQPVMPEEPSTLYTSSSIDERPPDLELALRLAADNPARFLPDLASSLNNLSVGLRDAGRSSEALEAIQEAAGHFRKLANTMPSRFERSLIIALNNLADCHDKLGNDDAARQARAEANELRARNR